MTAMTAGAASPVLIAGIATSSFGTATSVGSTLAENIINSKQIKQMNAAFEKDKEISRKLDHQLEELEIFRESTELSELLHFAENLLGEKHLLLVILHSIFTSVQSLGDDNDNNINDNEDKDTDEKRSRDRLLKQTSVDRFNQESILNRGVLAEGGKAIGQSVGLSVAFLAWDAVDLGVGVTDLVKGQGSQAAKVLRDKADTLERALDHTKQLHSLERPQ